MEDKLLQYENAQDSICVIDSGSLTDINLLHPVNADPPIAVTEYV